MKTLGIVGGIAPESTIDYYRRIVALYRERTRDGSYPPIVITSIDYIHGRYMAELVEGIYRIETRERLLEIMNRLKERENIEGLILGGTELPLLFREATETKIPLLNTTELHAQKAIDAVLAA